MHPRINEILEYLDNTRLDLRNAVDAVPATRREERSGPDRWSVAEVLEHLAIIDGRIGKLVAARIAAARSAGLGPESDASSILDSIDRSKVADRSRGVTAPDMLIPQSGADATAVWSRLEESRATLREAVISGDGLALSEIKQEHPVLGLINLYQWLVFVGSHEARHTAQIREIGIGFAEKSNAARE
jgi:hypothetical protein